MHCYCYIGVLEKSGWGCFYESFDHCSLHQGACFLLLHKLTWIPLGNIGKQRELTKSGMLWHWNKRFFFKNVGPPKEDSLSGHHLSPVFQSSYTLHLQGTKKEDPIQANVNQNQTQFNNPITYIHTCYSSIKYKVLNPSKIIKSAPK